MATPKSTRTTPKLSLATKDRQAQASLSVTLDIPDLLRRLGKCHRLLFLCSTNDECIEPISQTLGDADNEIAKVCEALKAAQAAGGAS